MSRLVQSLMIRLGAPAGYPDAFYVDVFLTVPFVFASLIGVVLGVQGRFTGVFWSCALIAALSLIGVSKRRLPLAALFLFAGIRFAFVFAVTFRLMASALDIAPGPIGTIPALRWVARDREYVGPFGLRIRSGW